ncbi:MAG: MBL fold metallo-hydrolase [Dehalococcoidia bacterium]|nr:MBL fold metallo-hydrolase [Dehalococcoidia bacterium]
MARSNRKSRRRLSTASGLAARARKSLTAAAQTARQRVRPTDGAGPAPQDTEPTVQTSVREINDHLLQHVVVVRQFSKTFPTSNVWILRDGNEAALIDAGFGDDLCIETRRKFFEGEGSNLNVGTIAFTHHHSDHTSGGRRLREILRANTAINPIDEALLHTPSTTAGTQNDDLPDDRDLAERAAQWREEALNTPIDVPLSDGDTFKVGGLTVRAVHTPGHTAGHNCYFVEETMTLFTGDNVLGVGTSAIGPPPHGDMQAYLDSLVRMRELQSKLFAPGHGPVVEATDLKIQELLDHRATRDRQIIDLIDHGYTTDRQIRRSLYPEIQKGLRRAAGGQVRAHLARMVGQGIVRVEEDPDAKVWKVELTK